MQAREANFDGIVGPTHSFTGSSDDNVAAVNSQGRVSNPRAAALQGISKMRRLASLGITQGVLPPHERPHIPTLRRFGFQGSDVEVLAAVAKSDRSLLTKVCSASSMWTANAATVSPGADTEDKKIHFTPANLGTKFHRSIEVALTGRILRALFADDTYFQHHESLPIGGGLGDEGAANHMRLCHTHGQAGVEVFIYGREAFDPELVTEKYLPRQTLEASKAVARLHKLPPTRTAFLRQSKQAIDEGAFHNDVVAVSNENLILAHECALHSGEQGWDELKRACDFDLQIVIVREADVSLKTAVKSYLFNSQLVSLSTPGEMALILPQEVRKNERLWDYLQTLIQKRGLGISCLEIVDVGESMGNGGGPACLRLRIVLTDLEQNAVGANAIFDKEGALASKLEAWVRRHYRDRLTIDDLNDPQLLDETKQGLDELTGILGLGSIYTFQLDK